MPRLLLLAYLVACAAAQAAMEVPERATRRRAHEGGGAGRQAGTRAWRGVRCALLHARPRFSPVRLSTSSVGRKVLSSSLASAPRPAGPGPGRPRKESEKADMHPDLSNFIKRYIKASCGDDIKTYVYKLKATKQRVSVALRRSTSRAIMEMQRRAKAYPVVAVDAAA